MRLVCVLVSLSHKRPFPGHEFGPGDPVRFDPPLRQVLGAWCADPAALHKKVGTPTPKSFRLMISVQSYDVHMLPNGHLEVFIDTVT